MLKVFTAKKILQFSAIEPIKLNNGDPGGCALSGIIYQ